MATFASAVEAWRSRVQSYAPDLVDFLLGWMTTESGGNPCALSPLNEAGLFQLMVGDNMNVAGTSLAALRTACSGQKATRPLTEAEKNEQVRAGVQYVRWCIDQARKKLAAVGASWSETSADFGKVVKFVHVAPSALTKWIGVAAAQLGRPPANWADLVPYAGAAGIPASWVANASKVGSYWTGVQIPLLLLAATAAAALVYYLRRKR